MKILNGLKLALLFILVIIGGVAIAEPSDSLLIQHQNKPVVIAVVLSGDKPVYMAALAALKQNLPANVQVEDYSIERWDSHLQSKHGARAELVVAIGSDASDKLLQTNLRMPILSMMLPSATFHHLLKKYPHAAARLQEQQLAAVFMDQPAERQLNLAMLINPQLTTFGTLYDSGAEELVHSLADTAQQKGLQFRSRQLLQNDNPLVALRKMYGRIDLYLAVPGKFIFNRSTAKWMLYLSLRSKKPLLGFSEEFVRAGALAAVYSTPEDISRQSAEWLQQYFAEQRFIGGAVFPSYFSVTINHDVAALLNLETGSDEMMTWELGKLERSE